MKKCSLTYIFSVVMPYNSLGFGVGVGHVINTIKKIIIIVLWMIYVLVRSVAL